MQFRRRHLRYFVTVADEGQITRAAQKLQVTQPALSRELGELESELGVRLMERHPRGISLTPAGERFLVSARAAVTAWTDAVANARSHAQTDSSAIEFGFLGVPPGLDSSGVLEEFAQAHPAIEVRFRELPFPRTPTKSWLADVDVAVCHAPPPDTGVWCHVLRHEPRVVLAPARHPLARHSQLEVAEVLDETFIGLHRSTEPGWAGFWSLDDHRGAPPAHVTPDRADNPQEVLASLAVRCAITTVPASVAQALANVPSGVLAIPLRDASPSTIMLVGHDDAPKPQVRALRAFARDIAVAAAELGGTRPHLELPLKPVARGFLAHARSSDGDVVHS
jgi:DNA-binding transcriptional LysR family regulator